ncbi:glycosyl transferase [Histoplasma capsulatum G186AR]|uniref:Glycosyl transferase n=2 Tax=Ajellomyces capsulatus TaxID=5037 RepID=C0NYK4_AJECG|nr:glycosyl transferase [Histoplasma capsulatum G186AR]EEH03560.1 glycosyl transferase [Histoplasma capsulatum G186AR]KAG5293868.1 glycosyl transferase [Histoplasma capsulatum]QSS75320.1 glycosyl transferase [Histoplasma capsulatum G186AR]
MILGPRLGVKPLILYVSIFLLSIVGLYSWIYSSPPQYIGETLQNINHQNGLTKHQANELCGLYNWPVYDPRQGNNQNAPHPARKVYDIFLLNTELDWLEIRLNELNDQVDFFVVVESNTTFTGHPKPLLLTDPSVWAKFARFHHKIIHHIVEGDVKNVRKAFSREKFQRNAGFTQLFPTLGQPNAKSPLALLPATAPQLGDVIIVSDIDEIPRPATVTLLRICSFPRRVNLRSRFYYYSFQWLHKGPDWAHPQATYYEGMENTIKPDDLRKGSILQKLFVPKTDLFNASWHCSSCFATVKEMQTKITSFSHTEYNRPEFMSKEHIVEVVRTGKDLFDRPSQVYQRVQSNLDVPAFLKGEAEKKRFRYMLDRDGKDGGFVDFDSSGN